MSFDLTDIANHERTISVNFWNWHPTVEILRDANLIDAVRLEGLHESFSGTRITKEEARAIACHLRQHVLQALPHGARVLLDGSVTTEPDDGKLYRTPEESHKNYSATKSWLESFAEFCEACEGFEFN